MALVGAVVVRCERHRSTPRTVVREGRGGRCVVHCRLWSLSVVSTRNPPCERGLEGVERVLGAGAAFVTSWVVGDWFGVLVAHFACFVVM